LIRWPERGREMERQRDGRRGKERQGDRASCENIPQENVMYSTGTKGVRQSDRETCRQREGKGRQTNWETETQGDSATETDSETHSTHL
jgi:hypothetical protein